MFNRNYSKTIEEIVIFIKTTLQSAGFEKVVIGVSGGVDSATALTLLVKVVGRYKIFPVILPFDAIHPQAMKDARVIINSLKIPEKNITKIDIQNVVDDIAGHDKNISLLRKGNIMSRVRMIYLYDIARKNKALVCGTENKTEYMLGYFTRYGDEASDFEPLRKLYKTEVRQLARYLGVPEKIIEKHPTAGLWPGQTDEEEFGFSYADADKVLHLSFNKKLTSDQVIKTSGIDEFIVKAVLARVKKNSFKHQVPLIP